jgi:putative hydrolase of HD superfamily
VKSFSTGRVQRQLAFLAELDRLKSVVRQSRLINRERRENSAEHSWHLAMFALTLAEYADGVDALHVVKLLLVHDVVEIDVGDIPFHSAARCQESVALEERQAAERIFALLPPDQEFLSLWLEFEAGETANAKFAKALDRFQPLYLNTSTQGGTWTDNCLSEDQVIERYRLPIENGSAALWRVASVLIHRHFKGS